MFFRKKPQAEGLDSVLFHWSPDDPFKVRDLLNGGALCLGRTGSGKSSGSGKHLLRAIVSANSGGLILAAKPEDADDVREVFRQAGKSDRLLVINDDGELRCNFIGYLRKMRADTREITKAIMTIAECLNSEGGDGREDGKYWESQQERMLYCAVEVVKLGTGDVTAPELLKFISGAAQSAAELESESWRADYHYQLLKAAHRAEASEISKHDLDLATNYWINELPRTSSRTRSSVEAGVFQTLHVFNTGLVRMLASTTTNVSPDETLDGRWVLVNLPPSRYGESGKFINAGWKLLVQKAVMRRKAKPGDPINVIWADEAQEWVCSHDSYYLAQCRSHLGCQVFLTQSLHAIVAALGGNAGREKALGLLTNFSTKVLHSLGSPQDAQFASQLIGNELQRLVHSSSPPSEDVFAAMMGVSRISTSLNETMLPIVEPRFFMNGLRTGGAANDYCVDAIVVKSGEPFADGRNFKFVTFDQRG